MTIVEQLRRERDEYRKAYLNYLGLYNRVIELYADQLRGTQQLRASQKSKQHLVVQFKKNGQYENNRI